MRWTRIARLSAALALIVAVMVFAVPTKHWMDAELRSRADRPNPVIATPEETRAILGAALERLSFTGVPLPPPEPGEPPRPELNQVLILTNQSLCFGEALEHDCESQRTERLLGFEFDPLASRKLREELVAANQVPRLVDLSGIPGTKLVDSTDIQQIFAGGRWDDFYNAYPGSSGFAVISQPVLTEDRKQALIYVAHRCEGLCGTGTIHLLVRSGSSWQVLKEETLWTS